jgi:translation initiation factor 4G
MWDFTLGTDDEGVVLAYLEKFADTDEVHWGHWSLFKVAEVDGIPAAALCGFFENEYGPQSMMLGATEVNQKIGRTTEEMMVGWERAKSIVNIARPHEPGAWVVEHVATHPDYRRRGLVERLIHEMLERGRGRGARTAEIGVLIGNDKAQRAYEKCGFKVFEEARDAEFEAVYKCPGAYLMRSAI